MNVQTTDVVLLELLRNATLERFTIGSELYGLDNKDSDTDTICVYAQSTNQQNSFLWEHHNIQYASEECDLIFTTLQNFVRNLMIGDSLYNFELIHDEQVLNSDLTYLYDIADRFYSYGIIRGYLGIARRDLKHSIKNGKRFSHAYRSVLTAKMLYHDRVYTNDFRSYSKDDYDIMWALKNDEYDGNKHRLLEKLKDDVKDLREKLNDDLNHNRINRYMKKEHMKELDDWINDYCSTEKYLSIQEEVEYIDWDIYYEILEKGIRYD